MSTETRLLLVTVTAGLGMVPATLTILTDHVTTGAAVVGAVLAAWALAVRTIVRAEQRRNERMVDCAQAAIDRGGDPVALISLLRQRPADVEESDAARADAAGPWVFLHQRDW